MRNFIFQFLYKTSLILVQIFPRDRTPLDTGTGTSPELFRGFVCFGIRNCCDLQNLDIDTRKSESQIMIGDEVTTVG